MNNEKASVCKVGSPVLVPGVNVSYRQDDKMKQGTFMSLSRGEDGKPDHLAEAVSKHKTGLGNLKKQHCAGMHQSGNRSVYEVPVPYDFADPYHVLQVEKATVFLATFR